VLQYLPPVDADFVLRDRPLATKVVILSVGTEILGRTERSIRHAWAVTWPPKIAGERAAAFISR